MGLRYKVYSIVTAAIVCLGGTTIDAMSQTLMIRDVTATGGTIGSVAGSRRLSATVGQPIMGLTQYQGTAPLGIPTHVHQGFWVPIDVNATSTEEESSIVAGPDMIVYPNPMRTNVSVVVPVFGMGEARLVIRDLIGNLITELTVMATGDDRVEFEWDGRDREGNPVASGGYLCRAVVPTEMTGRMQVSTARIQVVR